MIFFDKYQILWIFANGKKNKMYSFLLIVKLKHEEIFSNFFI